MAGTVIALGVVAVAMVGTSIGVVGFVVVQLRGHAAPLHPDESLAATRLQRSADPDGRDGHHNAA